MSDLTPRHVVREQHDIRPRRLISTPIHSDVSVQNEQYYISLFLQQGFLY